MEPDIADADRIRSGRLENENHNAVSPSDKVTHPSIRHKDTFTPKDLARKLTDEPWKPGIWTRLPSLGILALLGVFGCIIFSATVVSKCDGVAVKSFRVRPTVLIAVSSATANTLLAFAYMMGSTITWWRQALHSCDLETLHNHWLWSRSFFAAVFSFRPDKPIVLASLLVTLAIIDGPLLQKSIIPSATKLIDVTHVHQTIKPLDKMPTGFSARKLKGSPGNLIFPNPSLFGLIDSTPLDGAGILDCPVSKSAVTCTTKFTGIGLIPYCDDPTFTGTDQAESRNQKQIYDLQVFWEPESKPNFKAESGQYTGIRFVSKFMPPASASDDKDSMESSQSPLTSGCALPTQNITSRQCWIVADRVVHTFNTQTFDEHQYLVVKESANGPSVEQVSLAPKNSKRQLERFLPSEINADTSTWGGLYLFFKEAFNSKITLEFDTSNQTDKKHHIQNLLMEGAQALLYLGSDGGDVVSWLDPSSGNDSTTAEDSNKGGKCLSLFGRDPFQEIVTWLQDKSVKISFADINPDHPALFRQNITLRIENPYDMYRVNYRFLFGGIAVMSIAALAVGLSFYGWWELGRDVSLSPLETARAFDAPIFSDSQSTSDQITDNQDSNSFGSCFCCVSTSPLVSQSHSGSVDVILRRFGHLRVSYGEKILSPEMSSNSDVRRMEIALKEEVMPPKKGDRIN